MSFASRLLTVLREATDVEAYKARLAQILKCVSPEKGLTRARIMGLTPECSRCGGSGHYSFNLTHGTMCYGCNGLRFVAPKNEAQWESTIRRAEKAASDGTLDDYLAALIAQKEAKIVKGAWLKRWQSSGVNKYDWHKLSEMHAKLANLNGFTSISVHNETKTHWMASDWSGMEEDEIRQCFLSHINSYYAVVFDFYTNIDTATTGMHSGSTPEAYATWLLELQDLLKRLDHFGNDLDSLVKKVPSLVSQAKKGAAFPTGTQTKGGFPYVSGPWVAKFIKAPDLLHDKAVQAVLDKSKKTWNPYDLTWPHLFF